MYLPLVNRRQAVRLRRMGFDWPVKDIFILHTARYAFPEDMGMEENWNRFDETMSRPNFPIVFQWLRETYSCKCELTLSDWKKNTYTGQFQLPGMKEPESTRIFKDREKAESELLDRIIAHLLSEKIR